MTTKFDPNATPECDSFQTEYDSWQAQAPYYTEEPPCWEERAYRLEKRARLAEEKLRIAKQEMCHLIGVLKMVKHPEAVMILEDALKQIEEVRIG